MKKWQIWDDKGKLIPLHLAKSVLEQRRVIYVAHQFHEYKEGVYRAQSDYVFERYLTHILGSRAKAAHVAEGMKFLQIQTSIDPAILQQQGRTINLKNGLLDIDSGLKPHTPQFKSITQIPINYDPNARCPLWNKCLMDWFPGETDVIDLLQEWMGYCLVPDSRHHKALILIGEGANGKSVFCEVLRSLVGVENVSAVSLNSLSRSFSVAELYGKLVNLSIEAEIKGGIEEGVFKQIVAGDAIQAERKYRDPFVFNPFVRLVVATNNLFDVADRSEGFYRRLMIVRFERAIAEACQNRELKSKLEAELPGILNWALVGLRRLEARDSFRLPKRVQDEVAEFQRWNNPVGCWLEDCCELDPDSWKSSADLNESYGIWARTMGQKPLASNRFGIELQRLRGVQRKRSSCPARTQGYQGIRITRMLV
jgi:putative DNA primase/helicase